MTTYANGLGGGEPLPAPPVSQPLNPTGVTVTSFSVHPRGAAAVLRWRTASEVSTAGFNVYRERAGKRVRLNRVLIHGPGRAAGHAYSWLDRAPGRSSRYVLQEVRRDGSRVLYGPVRLAR